MPKWNSYVFNGVCNVHPCPISQIDVAIIDIIFRKIVFGFEDDITLWRFHRRCRSNDKHELKLDIFCEDEVGEKIYTEISSFDISGHLSTVNITLAFDWPEKGNNYPTDASITHFICEDYWSEEIKNTWPRFITYCSNWFLDILNEIKSNLNATQFDDFTNVAEILKQYDRINGRFNSLMELEGSHPLFHHIHAIIGYPKMRAEVIMDNRGDQQMVRHTGNLFSIKGLKS